jgi:hypothetical protein
MREGGVRRQTVIAENEVSPRFPATVVMIPFRSTFRTMLAS